jgi:hypothetical protein
MKTAIPFLLFVLLSQPPSPPVVYECSNGMISFLSWAEVENIDATSTRLCSALDTLSGEITFSVPINSFEFKNSKMRNDFNEDFMESDKYPDALYKGHIQTPISWNKDGKYEVIASGVLTIHHISSTRTDTAIVFIHNGQFSMEGHLKVQVHDFGIKIPAFLSRHISEEIYILWGCTYTPSRTLAHVN